MCTITDNRRFSEDLPQGGLEVPCKLRFRGEVKFVEKMKKLLMPWPVASSVAHDDQHPRKVSSVADDGNITANHTIPVIWLSLNNITLTDDDRRIIVAGEELNDKHHRC